MNSTEEASARKSINELKIAELRKELEQRGVDHKGLKLKHNLIEALENVSQRLRQKCPASVSYDFVYSVFFNMIHPILGFKRRGE